MLYEKNIDFIPYVVDLSNGEQYSSWFLNLNPKGDVPVLQDGVFVVPNSHHIINYVETKFRGGRLLLDFLNLKTFCTFFLEKHLLLKPYNPDSLQYDQMMAFERSLTQLPVGALSLGSFIHDDLKLVPKAPFIGPVRLSCLSELSELL